MTVSSITPVNNYAGNGSTTTFDFDFLIESEDELKVQVTNNLGVQTTLTLNTDYTIHEVGNEAGSYITYPKAGSSHSILASDEVITLSLELDIEQEKEIKNSSKLNLITLEWCLDYLTRLIQILDRKMQRSIKVQESTSIDTETLVNNIYNVAAELPIIEAVNANQNNINAVNNNAANINTVSGNTSNINTVSGSIANVNTVANNISAVNNVSSNTITINKVAEDLFGDNNIGTVAADITNINSVANNETNINSVANNETNINTTVNNLSAINAAPSHAQTATTKANESKIWAEGTDIEVQALGGEHSSKIWNAFLSLGKGKYLLESFWSDYQINDQSCLRADTFSWHSGTTYYLAYNHLITDISGKTLQSETVAGVAIQYYLADDGHKICPASEEVNVLSLYNTTGIAWYYILDSENTQFKLPRTKYGFVGYRDKAGKFVNESLPKPTHTHTRGSMNIVGSNITMRVGTDGTGAMRETGSPSQPNLSGGSSAYLTSGNFDASRSGAWTGSTSDANSLPSVYQSSASVQQKSTQMYLYFYVGQFSQTATEQTAGLNSELFNNKLDLNASNLSVQGKSLISGLSMPSDSGQNITVGASGTTWTAPKSGWICLSVTLTSESGYGMLEFNSIRSFASRGNASTCYCSIPIVKGGVCTISYNNATVNTCLFKQAQGN